MKILSWIIGLPLAVIAVIFAVANRQTAQIDLWPFPLMLDLPVYLAVLGALLLGLLLGALLAGTASLRWRRQARLARRTADQRGREAEHLREQLQALEQSRAAPATEAPAPAAAAAAPPSTIASSDVILPEQKTASS